MPHLYRPRRRPVRSTAPWALFLLLGLLAPLPGATAARAQSVEGQPTDLRFTVRDATTGQPAAPERLTIAYVSGRLNTVLDMKPGGAAFTAPAVPVKDIGQYIVTLWYQGVPYWWQKRGSDLLAGSTALDVFGVTESREGVAITGLNLIVRYRDTTVDLELMVEIGNQAKPQVVVSRGSGTFALQLPAGSTNIEATYERGPEPTPVPVTLSGTLASIAMPLTPGANRLRLTARAPWGGQLELPVGSDLAIAGWSLLTAPPSLTVEAAEMQGPDEQSVPGFVRRVGPTLAAGHTLTARLGAGAGAGKPEPLFETPAPGDETAAGDAAGNKAPGGRRFPAVLASLVVLIIIGVVAVARRGRS
jgi:hypothetical protein